MTPKCSLCHWDPENAITLQLCSGYPTQNICHCSAEKHFEEGWSKALFRSFPVSDHSSPHPPSTSPHFQHLQQSVWNFTSLICWKNRLFFLESLKCKWTKLLSDLEVQQMRCFHAWKSCLVCVCFGSSDWVWLELGTSREDRCFPPALSSVVQRIAGSFCLAMAPKISKLNS